MTTAPDVTALLADRYRLEERIAVGGMGEVWRATDTVLDRVVAVKTLKPEFVGDADFRARFRAEARHAGRLSHPGIASVYDFGESGDRAYLVMELVDGEPLSTLLHREGTLPADRVLDVVAQTAAALQAAHEGGVVHRDVKPGNLLVRPDGVVKVTDFGIASATDAVPLTRTGQVVGTAYYLAPEQARGTSAGPRSDLYSLGVVAYECLAGVRPFPGDQPVVVLLAHLQQEPPPLPDSVPAPVAALVLALLAKDPDDRPASAGALAAQAVAVRGRLGGGPDALLPVSPPPAAREPAGRTRALPALAPAVPLSDTGAAEGPRTSLIDTPGADRPSQRRAVRVIAVLLALLAAGFGLRGALADRTSVVPSVAAGTASGAAVDAVREAGLTPRTRAEASATAPQGTVLALEPAAGTELDDGAPVTVVVSSGRPPVRVTAAGLVGRSAGAARDGLLAAGLVPRLAYDGEGSPVGTVGSVEPVGDLPAGSTVVLHVVPEAAAEEQAPAPEPAPVETTPAAPAPAPEPEPKDEPAPAKGGGKGKGKG